MKTGRGHGRARSETGVRAVVRMAAVLVMAVTLTGVISVAPEVIAGTSPAGADGPWTVTTFGTPSSQINGVACPGSGVCVAVGAQNYDMFGLFGDSLIEYSRDGGRSWTSVPSIPDATLASVSCPTTSDCWAAGWLKVASSSVGIVLRSINGGATWSTEAQTPTGFSSPGSLNGTGFTGITCPTSTQCYVWGDDSYGGVAFASSDGGSSWYFIQPEQELYLTGAVNGISCWSALSCMLVTNDSTYYGVALTIDSTSNGGATWTEDALPDGLAQYDSLVCPGAGMCTVTGSESFGGGYSADGLIASTSNNGASWTTTPIPWMEDVKAISCAATCMAVGPGNLANWNRGEVAAQTGSGAWGALSQPTGTPDLDAVSCIGANPCVVGGTIPNGPAPGDALVGVPADNSPAPPPPLAGPVVGMASVPNGDGYWLVNAAGAVSAHGAAQLFGSMAGQPLNAPISHIVAASDGKGYWLVAKDGGTFSFGDAQFFGSMGSSHLNAPVVDMAPTADDRGYWLVASDGGIFSFGDAVFHGSMGAAHLNQPVVGIADDMATGGYWEVASDGGIFAFDAPFYGSTGALHLNQPITSMAPAAGGAGYWFVATDGGVFSFGSAAFRGSMGGSVLNAAVVGMASDVTTDGYWLVGADGGIFTFGAPFYGAD